VDIGICGEFLLFHRIHCAKAPFFLCHQGIRRRFSAKAEAFVAQNKKNPLSVWPDNGFDFF
jgi:hypothetical protein